MIWLILPLLVIGLIHAVLFAAVFVRVVDATDATRRLEARVPHDRFGFFAWMFSARYKALKDPLVSNLIWPLRLTTSLLALIGVLLVGGAVFGFAVH